MLAATHASISKVLHTALHDWLEMISHHFIPAAPDSATSLIGVSMIIRRKYTYLSQNHEPLQIAR